MGDVKLTRARLNAIKAKIKAWRQIAQENDPMNAMLDVMEELVAALASSGKDQS